jgi:hypothetical protein
MNKNIFLLFVFFMVCFSCRDQVEDPLELEDGDADLKECGIVEINESEFLMMQFVPKEVSSNSINKRIVENHTMHEVFWGPFFSLEYYERNNWKVIPIKGMIFEDIGYRLDTGDYRTSKQTISFLYTMVKQSNRGKKGKYRIIHKFIVIPIGNYKLCAEFEII